MCGGEKKRKKKKCRVWRIKKEGEKKEKRMKYGTCVQDKKIGKNKKEKKKKEMLSQYFHNKF